MILFLGSIIGGIVQCGQIFLSAADLYSSNVPDWLNYRSGSVLMVFTTLFIFPACMVELMTQASGSCSAFLEEEEVCNLLLFNQICLAMFYPRRSLPCSGSVLSLSDTYGINCTDGCATNIFL